MIPQLLGQHYTPKKEYLDQLTKEFIQSRLTYRYLIVQTEDSHSLVRNLEHALQYNTPVFRFPTINGKIIKGL